jgi:hypothetical protein
VFDWPEDGRLVVPLRNEVKHAYLLADASQAALVVERSGSGAVVALPENAPDPIVSVVAVEIDGKPDVVAPPRNLAARKPVEVSSFWPGRPELEKHHITDGNPGSMWATEELARSGWVVVDLEAEHTITGARVSDAPYHRIRAFDLEAFVDGAWKKLATGTQMGNPSSLTFPEVRAQRFRLNIHDATDTPTLADFQVLGY